MKILYAFSLDRTTVSMKCVRNVRPILSRKIATVRVFLDIIVCHSRFANRFLDEFSHRVKTARQNTREAFFVQCKSVA